MLTNISGAKCIGIDAVPVTVEVDIASGIGIHLVGLADAAVKESLLRTITALQSMGFRIPGRKIVINLAPADMHKKGSGYDVPIAIGIIAASGQADLKESGKYVIMGELGLDGTIRDIPGALPIAELAAKSGKGCILPAGSAAETAEFCCGRMYGVRNLGDVIRILSGTEDCSDLVAGRFAAERKGARQETDTQIYDFCDIIGQSGAKRGLEIAAAGGHNAIMIGPPGAGKSTLARALSGILPPMSIEEALQTSKIYSVAGKSASLGGPPVRRPFRAPHYSASIAALTGGGSETIMPGEVSLAHNGVLFIDELCEAPPKVIEALRAPMEDRKVTVSRLRNKVEFPASFMLIAATNPCPCGYYGEGDRCTCTPAKRAAYMAKLSGPIMDRIDIHLWLKPLEASGLVNRTKAETSAAVAERVRRAREIQKARFASAGIFTNSEMSGKDVVKYCRLSDRCKSFLERMIDGLGLSGRACDRILKLARTISDLEAEEEISLSHLSEAAGYRFLDKKEPLL